MKTFKVDFISGLVALTVLFGFCLCILTHLKDEYVDGNNHIYYNQALAFDCYPNKLSELSPRASYLNTKQYLTPTAKIVIEGMIDDAEKNGMCLVVMSSYRSNEQQQKIYNESQDKTLVALPGRSEHQTGMAVDFGACPTKRGIRDDSGNRLELKNDFETLPEYQWLLNNASKYNFEQSFTKENQDITGFPAESWHWKFIIE